MKPNQERTEHPCGCVYERHPLTNGLRVRVVACDEHKEETLAKQQERNALQGRRT